MMNPEQMRAAVMINPGEIVVKDYDVPRIGNDEVLIRVKYCGICGTDIHIYNGVYSREFLPLIPGHEFVGHIAATGEAVTDFKENELVTADINMSCGKCFYCRRNAPLMCKEMKQLGIHTNGAFAEYVAVPANYVYRLPSDLPVENGAFIEPISCVVRAYRKGGLTFANSVVIIGAGPIGLLHVQMARHCGAAPIIVIDRRPKSLENAREMGADFTILSDSSDNQVQSVKRHTDGRGADFVIESVGKVETYEMAFQMVRPGGRIMAFGIAEAGVTAKFEPFQMVLTELSMTGSVASAGNDVFDAIKMVSYNRISLQKFTSVKMPLKNIEEGFERFRNDKDVLKILISMY
jgi:2-desacetyl-2-hydroxyethyl bacteriochlorophyllide A dehydrogenase